MDPSNGFEIDQHNREKNFVCFIQFIRKSSKMPNIVQFTELLVLITSSRMGVIVSIEQESHPNYGVFDQMKCLGLSCYQQ